MKIKRFFAPDIRQAMRMVRKDQGPDAVILSNRNVDGGVEIVAAKDFDEQIVTKQIETVSNSLSKQTANQQIANIANASRATTAPSQPTKLPLKQKHKCLTDNGLDKKILNQRTGKTENIQNVRATSGAVDKLAVNRRQESATNSQITQLQKEIQQMRRILDGHLSETTWMQTSYENPTRIDLLRYLSSHGFSKSLSMKAAKTFGVDIDFENARQQVGDYLTSEISLNGNDLLDFGGIIALVGPTGVGKTTTIAKLAAKFRLKHGANQVALISIDNERIGAHEQLATYGRILGVPVRTASSPQDLNQLLTGFLERRLVLIDTAGMGQHDDRLARQLEYFEALETHVKTFLVISAATQLSVMKQVVSAFDRFQPQAHILTKLDEAAQLGAALSLLIEHRLPVSFVTDGQSVPEDVHRAHPQNLVNRCFRNDNDVCDEQSVQHEHFFYQDWLAQANV